jgi:alpha-beta hydrolase superfamily lysophospholipase
MCKYGAKPSSPGLLATAWTALGLLTSVQSSAEASAAPRCERLVFPVALASGQPADYTAVGWLCSDGPIEHKTVQVLVHGATYDHNVWDFPYHPQRYSYVRAATAAGYATLNLDRLGHGQSSRVPGDLLDLNVGAYALHQIITALRSGQIFSQEFGLVQAERILLAGESLGGNLVWMEAALYGDVDGLVVAGSAHSFSIGLQRVVDATWPVENDPFLGPQNFPSGYFTTIPGTRDEAYYEMEYAKEKVVAVDELLKQTLTAGEIGGIFPSLPLSAQVAVPTLITVGDFDDIFCDPPSCTVSGSLANETSFYGPDSCAELLIMPEAGHVLNLHHNAPDYFALVREWADRRVGASSLVPAPQPCNP